MKVFLASVLLALLAASVPAYAQTAEDLSAAARATGIEGRWQSDKATPNCANQQRTGNATIEIADGVLVRTYMDFGEKLVTRYTIKRVEGATVFAIETSPDSTNAAETSFKVEGATHAFFQPEKRVPGRFVEEASTHRYNRC